MELVSDTPCLVKNARSFSLPPASMAAISRSFHASMDTERTYEMCTPSERWRPLHSRQKKMPYDTLAHCGPCAPQSTQRSLPASARSRACTSGAMLCTDIAADGTAGSIAS
jgi:hypothetical protein